MLCFCAGAGEIRRVERLLGRMRMPGATTLHVLFGMLSPEEQDAAIRSGTE